MYKNRFRGFTLIELLVVIAIIGILSAVVLASLSTARTKGADAAEQSDLATVQTQAEIFYSNNGNKYNTDGTTGLTAGACPTVKTATGNMFSADQTIVNSINGALSANGGAASNVTKCSMSPDGSSYAISIQSKSNTSNYYCVDSTGYSGVGTKQATGGLNSGAATPALCN